MLPVEDSRLEVTVRYVCLRRTQIIKIVTDTKLLNGRVGGKLRGEGDVAIGLH